MRTIAVTGSASGIGAAVAGRLRSAGDTVIGVDLRDAEVIADLSEPKGRSAAVAAVLEACGGALDGLVTCAGLGGLPGRPASLLVEVNYVGTIEFLSGLRPALAAGTSPAAVAIASNSTTIHPGVPLALVDACVAGDLPGARRLADEAGPVATYPATKTAVCRWVRRQATSAAWAGSGIRLNAVAPGMIETPLLAEQRGDPRIAPLLDALPIPLGHPGTPDEVAAVVAFLLSPDSSLLCGSIVLADGGTEALLRPDAYPIPWEP
jgi:NAD(P)-dependent dehydrogenase (short-subunit alcohol dehydrogenase family)